MMSATRNNLELNLHINSIKLFSLLFLSARITRNHHVMFEIFLFLLLVVA